MNFLGVITVGMGVAKNNADTAAPFTIPSECQAVYLQPDTAGVQFEVGYADDFATTAARGAFIGAANLPAGPFKLNPTASKWISVFNPTGGGVNVRVYGTVAVG